MVLDSIRNRELYFGISEQISEALIFLESTDFSDVKPGKYEPCDHSFIYIIDEYETQSLNSKDLEAHRKCIDVQYIAEGSELIGYAQLADQTVTTEYSLENDIAFYSGESIYLPLSKGDFAIFFPKDLHKPGVNHVISPVKKVVVKIAV